MFELSSAAIDGEPLKRRVASAAAGACVVFEGWVREENGGRAVTGLEYEAYPALAVAEGEKIVSEAIARFGVIAAVCVHRIGELKTGELAVWVGVAAGHRGAAFDACRWIIDEIKSRVPIWKNERYAGGESGWVNAPKAEAAPRNPA